MNKERKSITLNKRKTKEKSWFFEKINRTDKPLARVTAKNERTHKLLVSGIKQDITTDPADIKRIVTGHCEQLYTHRFDNLDEMDQFLEKCKLLQLTQFQT